MIVSNASCDVCKQAITALPAWSLAGKVHLCHVCCRGPVEEMARAVTAAWPTTTYRDPSALQRNYQFGKEALP